MSVTVIKLDLLELALDGRHPLLVRSGGDFGQIEVENAAYVLLQFDTSRKNLVPDEGVDLIAMRVSDVHAGGVLAAGQECLEGLEGIDRAVDEVRTLNLPGGRRDMAVVVVQLVAIFENA